MLNTVVPLFQDENAPQQVQEVKKQVKKRRKSVAAAPTHTTTTSLVPLVPYGFESDEEGAAPAEVDEPTVVSTPKPSTTPQYAQRTPNTQRIHALANKLERAEMQRDKLKFQLEELEEDFDELVEQNRALRERAEHAETEGRECKARLHTLEESMRSGAAPSPAAAEPKANATPAPSTSSLGISRRVFAASAATPVLATPRPAAAAPLECPPTVPAVTVPRAPPTPNALGLSRVMQQEEVRPELQEQLPSSLFESAAPASPQASEPEQIAPCATPEPQQPPPPPAATPQEPPAGQQGGAAAWLRGATAKAREGASKAAAKAREAAQAMRARGGEAAYAPATQADGEVDGEVEENEEVKEAQEAQEVQEEAAAEAAAEASPLPEAPSPLPPPASVRKVQPPPTPQAELAPSPAPQPAPSPAPPPPPPSAAAAEEEQPEEASVAMAEETEVQSVAEPEKKKKGKGGRRRSSMGLARELASLDVDAAEVPKAAKAAKAAAAAPPPGRTTRRRSMAAAPAPPSAEAEETAPPPPPPAPEEEAEEVAPPPPPPPQTEEAEAEAESAEEKEAEVAPALPTAAEELLQRAGDFLERARQLDGSPEAYRAVDESDEPPPPPPPPPQEEQEQEQEAVEEPAAEQLNAAAAPVEAVVEAGAAVAAEEEECVVPASLLPTAEALRGVSDEAGLLEAAIELATHAWPERAAEEGAAEAVGGILREVAALAAMQQRDAPKPSKPSKSSKKADGSCKTNKSGGARRVRFAAFDLSAVSPPKAQRQGAEKLQEQLLERLVGLAKTQRGLFFPPADGDSCAAAAAAAAAARRFARCVGGALAALAEAGAGLPEAMRAAARFYAAELRESVGVRREPVLARRLEELLSSSLRYHLSMVFAEEEGAEPSSLLQTVQARVREHAAAHGFEINCAEGAEESFAAVVTTMMEQMQSHAALLLAPGSATREALQSAQGGGKQLIELDADAKDGLLQWSQAHTVLLQVFGPREQLERLQAARGNGYHFEKLATYAAAVRELGLEDEAYLAPLADLQQFQRQLHADVGLSKAAREGLMVYGMNAKRRSARKSLS